MAKRFLRHLWSMTERAHYVDSDLLVQCQGHVKHVTLNRPHALNALNLSMVRDLTSNLLYWKNDPGTSVVTLMGAGDKAFCSGGDLKSITFSSKQGGNYGQQFFYEEFTLNHIIGTFPKPLISIMNGITFGGAAGLSVIGRFCVATEKTVFCMPECAIGLFPDVGSGYYLSRLPGNLGLFLGLTGHRLKGRDVVRAGLSSHYIDHAHIPLLEEALENLPHPVSMETVDKVLTAFQEKSETKFPDKFSLEEHRQQIEDCFTAESVEEIVENLQQDGSEWAMKQLSALDKMSPTSLKITFRLLKEGVNLSLSQSLCTEYRLTQRCVADLDFHEGIRAVILDKDHCPSWTPSTLEEVTEQKLDYYFSPLSHDKELILPETVS
ncbi:3-hydroxyisobutyryl-CoA hydrolase, mitochondrial-like [Physella acuta]|uniref:3-hydroxyisobutyryl-CoA hydrolase, mitochondrial-like n=1 Tax=Physella acuta TaxID=109671 RepID=UPI0027DB2D18|nr:3-hydroxyisobutyryl-CoA hydrolase, mitochondrial-like [Physella acuta]